MSSTEAHVDPEIGLDDSDDETVIAGLPLLEKNARKRVTWGLATKRSIPSRNAEKRWQHRALAHARHGLLIGFAIIGVIGLAIRVVKHFQRPPMGFQLCYCGNSTKEAVERGCKFDLLGPSWAPDHCRDDELTAEFLKAGTGPNGTWEFWWDHEHTQPMSIEEVSMLADDPEGAFYGTWEFHVKHCTYQWRKHTRGLEKGVTHMDVENVGLGHIQHCEGVILRQLPVRAKIPLNVPYVGWEFVPDRDHLHTNPDMGHGHRGVR